MCLTCSFIPNLPISEPLTSIFAKTPLAINPPCLEKYKFVEPLSLLEIAGLIFDPVPEQWVINVNVKIKNINLILPLIN